MSSVHKTIQYEDVRTFFAEDGALRDIYAFETAECELRNFVKAVYSSRWPVESRIDDKTTTDHAAILAAILDPDSYMLMSINVDGAILNTHFYCETEIELDLAPSEVTDANFSSLLEFVALLSEATKRNVFVTEEGGPEYAAFVHCHAEAQPTLLARTSQATALGKEVGRTVERLVNRYRAELRVGLDDPLYIQADSPARLRKIESSEPSIRAAEVEWRESIYHPDLLEWHTELTHRQFHAMTELDGAFHWLACAYASTIADPSYDLLSEQLEFWGRYNRACSAFGVSSS